MTAEIKIINRVYRIIAKTKHGYVAVEDDTYIPGETPGFQSWTSAPEWSKPIYCGGQA